MSVIVPTYRRADFLERALRSVRTQTYVNWELHVVDDNEEGSPDQVRTYQYMQRFRRDSRVKYVIHGTSRGAAAARNVGIRRSKGEVLAFLDDDDEWFPPKLQAQIDALRAAPAGTAAVVTSLISVKHSSGEVQLVEPELGDDLARRLLIRNVLKSTSTLMCRRDVLVSVGMFDETLPARQDADLYVRIAARHGFVRVARPLVRFHQHGRERIGDDVHAKLAARKILLDKHRALFEASPRAHHFNLKLVGRMHLAASNPQRARWYFRHALERKPFDASLGAYLAYSHLPSKVRRGARRMATWARDAHKSIRSVRAGRAWRPSTHDSKPSAGDAAPGVSAVVEPEATPDTRPRGRR